MTPAEYKTLRIQTDIIIQYGIYNLPSNMVDSIYAIGDVQFAYSLKDRKMLRRATHLLDAYCGIVGIKPSILNLNKKTFLARFIRGYIGFLYSIHDLSIKNIYSILRVFIPIMEIFCRDKNIAHRPNPEYSHSCVTAYSLACILEFSECPKDVAALALYKGWVISSKEDIKTPLNLALISTKFGSPTADRVAARVDEYLCAYPVNTVRAYLPMLRNILDFVHEVYNGPDDLVQLATPSGAKLFIDTMYKTRKLEAQISGWDLSRFHKWWKRVIAIANDVFMGIFSDFPTQMPFTTLHVPKFTNSTNIRTDKKGHALWSKLIVGIPLYYRTDEAILEVCKSIVVTQDYVLAICQEVASETIASHENRIEAAKTGTAIVHRGTVGRGKTSKTFANLCKTWEAAPFTDGGFKSITSIWGSGRHRYAREMGLLTNTALLPFLYLIIEEYPLITEQWFINLELFDANGKLYGIREAGTSMIAVSTKMRKKAHGAQQEIILSDTAAGYFRSIIELTRQARQFLKNEGDDDWRFLLLSAGNGFNRPRRIKKLYPLDDRAHRSALSERLLSSADRCQIANVQDIYSSLSLTSMRATTAVKRFFKNKSVEMMAMDLGHDKYHSGLLRRYLPASIEQFFLERSVRIMQTALIMESCKKSPKLGEIVNLPECELLKFLDAHPLRPLPPHLELGTRPEMPTSDSGQLYYDEIYISVTEIHLLIFLSIFEEVERNKCTNAFSDPEIFRWYPTAKYVVERINNATLANDADISSRVISNFQLAKSLPKFNFLQKNA